MFATGPELTAVASGLGTSMFLSQEGPRPAVNTPRALLTEGESFGPGRGGESGNSSCCPDPSLSLGPVLRERRLVGGGKAKGRDLGRNGKAELGALT